MDKQAKEQEGEKDVRLYDKDDASYRVKNTFLEVPIPGDDTGRNTHKRRSRSDIPGHCQDPRLSPLVVASKSPNCSPLLKPTDEKLQAVPIDEVNFELLEESALGPYDGTASVGTAGAGGAGEMVAQSNANLGRREVAYVVPTTPSPFLHSAFPPVAMVPPFGAYGFGGLDMGLPPAFAEGDGQDGVDGTNFVMQDADGQFMQGMSFLPEMYDGAWQGGDFVPGAGCGYGWGGWGQGEGAEGGGFGDMTQDMSGMGVGHDAAACAAADYSACEAQDPDATAAAAKAPAKSAEVEEGASAARRESVEVRPAKEKRDRKSKNRDRDEERAERAERPERKGRDHAGDDSRGNADSNWREDRRKDGGDAGGGKASGDAGDTPANYTTVMLRNIPNKYTREMLIKQLSVEFDGLFDFMYLPIDFKNKCNVGYGFINFRTPEACADFVSKFHGVDVRKCLPGLNSKKIVEVTPARVQGLSENVRRLRNSPVMNQLQDHPEWMPLLFNELGEEEPFPMPDTHLPPVKPRGRHREAKPGDS